MNKTQKISDFEFENTAFNQSSKNLVHSTPDNSAVDLNKTRKADGDDLKNYKCLCTICTCGRHNCPKKTKNLSRPGNTYYNKDLNDVNRTTEYSKSFQEKNPDVRQKIIQKSCDDIISSGKKIALDSNYKQDFKPFSRNIYLHHEKAKGFPDNEILFKSDENKKFSQSSYAKDYAEKEIIPTKKIEKQGSPNNISPHKTSFQSSTSYNRSFSKPNRDDYNKLSPIKPSNGHIFDKNQEKIAEQSTYNTNFDKKCQVKSQPFTPSKFSSLQSNQGKSIENSTSYSKEYQLFSTEKYCVPKIIKAKKSTNLNNSVETENQETTYELSFKKIQISDKDKTKPIIQPSQSDQIFNKTSSQTKYETSYRSTYSPKKTETFSRITKKNNCQKMNKYLINGSDDTHIGNEWKTTNQNCYIKPENYNISKNTYKKFDTPNLISGSLESTLYKFQSSLNKSDYKDPGKIERRALIVPKKNGNIVSYDTTPNQMTSSYGSSYSTKKFDKSAQEICNKLRSKQLNTFRLDNNLRNDDGTTNKRKLTQWWENIEKSRVTNALHMIKCPAEGLKNQSGLVDRNGHQFYVKVQ